MSFAPRLQVACSASDEQIARLRNAVDRACRAIARGRSGVHACVDTTPGETEWTIDPDNDRIVIVESDGVWRRPVPLRAAAAPLADLERLLAWIDVAAQRMSDAPDAVARIAGVVAWSAGHLLESPRASAMVVAHTPARPGRATIDAPMHPQVGFSRPFATSIQALLPLAVALTRQRDTLWRLSPVESAAMHEDSAVMATRAVRILGEPEPGWFPEETTPSEE